MWVINPFYGLLEDRCQVRSAIDVGQRLYHFNGLTTCYL